VERLVRQSCQSVCSNNPMTTELIFMKLSMRILRAFFTFFQFSNTYRSDNLKKTLCLETFLRLSAPHERNLLNVYRLRAMLQTNVLYTVHLLVLRMSKCLAQRPFQSLSENRSTGFTRLEQLEAPSSDFILLSCQFLSLISFTFLDCILSVL
jgi:hypothetical protein